MALCDGGAYLLPSFKCSNVIVGAILLIDKHIGTSGLSLKIESTLPWLPNNCQYKVLLYLLPFGRTSNVKLQVIILQFDPDLGGITGSDCGSENDYNRNVGPTFLFNFCIHYLPISDTIYQPGRQTDTAILSGVGLCSLCSSIGGLKTGLLKFQPFAQNTVVKCYNNPRLSVSYGDIQFQWG